jgi:hypothetical protein
MAILDVFLKSIAGFLQTQNAGELKNYLRVEPPLPDEFMQLSKELKSSWGNSASLEAHLEKLIPDTDEGGVWPGFLVFMKEYLEFWRDVNFDDLLETHAQLSALVK